MIVQRRTRCSSPARRAAAIVLSAVVGVLWLFQGAAAAHSLESSSLSVRITEDGVAAKISVALATLDEAMGTNNIDSPDLDDYAGGIINYIDDHLSVEGSDGTAWTETYTNAARETVEGIESFSVQLSLDAGGTSFSQFTLTYDAVIEADASHEVVVVLTDSKMTISTAGILAADSASLTITDGSHQVPVWDMIRYGFDHVLEGADHLLFLIVLLLPAPLAVVARRWEDGPGPIATAKKVLHVVTAFTIGHSITLVASALGWVRVPSRPVEILIAISVGVSAVHAIRPIINRGEVAIAGGFGLVHGLAFAGILDGLGLVGTTSLLTLLAFNIGIELAQIATAAIVFPSLYVVSRTRCYPWFRVGAAGLAIAMSAGWVIERLDVTSSPFAGLEDVVIENPWHFVIASYALALAASTLAGSTFAASTPAMRPNTDPAVKPVPPG